MRRFEPGLVGMRDAHPRIDALQTVHGGVHLGDKNRLVAGLLGSVRHRRLENRVVVSKVWTGRSTRGEGKGAGPRGAVGAERVRDAGSVAGHPEAGQAGSEAAAARRGAFPRVEALSKRRGIIRNCRRRRARAPYFVACRS